MSPAVKLTLLPAATAWVAGLVTLIMTRAFIASSANDDAAERSNVAVRYALPLNTFLCFTLRSNIRQDWLRYDPHTLHKMQ